MVVQESAIPNRPSTDTGGNKPHRWLSASRIAMLYALVGVLWILASDWLLFHLIGSTDDKMFVAILKGTLYVAITASLVYWLIRALNRGLEESEKRYRTIVENQTEFIVRWTPDGTRSFVNPAYCIYFETTFEKAIGLNFFHMIPAEDIQIIKDKLERLTPENPEATAVHRVFRPDGSIAWNEWNDRGIFDEAGRLIEIQSVGRDVSAKMKMAQLLCDSEELFRRTFEETASGMAHQSLDGRFVRVNRTLCDVIGYSREELLEKTFHEITHPDDIGDNLTNAQKLIKGEISHYQTEKRYIRKDGSPVWVNVGVSILRDPSGAPLNFVVAVEDITEYKTMLGRIGHLNSMLASVRDVNQLITKENDQAHLIREACRILVSVPSFESARIVLLNETGAITDETLSGKEDARITSVLEDRYSKATMPGYTGSVQGNGRSARFVSGEVSGTGFHRHRYPDNSFAMTTSLQFDGRLHGVLAVVTEKNYNYAEQDDALFQEVADDIGFALSKIEMQKALAESEEKFRIFADATYDWENWIGLDGHHIYVSPSCERITGYPPQAFYDDPKLLQKIIHDDDREEFLRHKGNVLSTKADECAGTFRIVRPDGEIRWIGHVCQPVVGKDGQYLGRRGSNRDITTEKHAEFALRESQRHYQNLFDAVPDAIILHEMSPSGPGKFIDVNAEACRRLQYTKEEFLTRTPVDLNTPEGRINILEITEKLWRTGNAVFNSKHVKKDGTVISVELSSHLFEWDGRAVVLSVARDITERVLAENHIRQSKELLETILESIPVMVASFDKENHLIWVNRQWQQTLGWRLEEAKSINVFEALYPDAECRKSVIQRMASAESVWQDFKTRRHDGMVLDTTWANVPLSDGTTIGIGLDITDRKRAEKALQISQERLKLALESANLGLWDWDIPTDHIVINAQWAKMLGYELDELRPDMEMWKEHLYPEDAQRIMETLNAHLNGEKDLYETEYRMRSKSGEEVWILDRGKVVEWDGAGKPVRAAGTHIDITERKKSEQNLLRLYAAIEQLPDLVMITGLRGSIEYVNPAFERITGYTREDVIGKIPKFILPDDGNEYESYMAIMDFLVKGKSWSGITKNSTKDGRVYYQDTTMAPVLDPDNVPFAYVGIGRDVTLEMKREACMRQSQKLEAIGALAGGIAHDFNNILQGILGYTQLVYDSLPESQKERLFLQEVLVAVERAAGLIKQILTFSRQAEQEPRPLLLHIIVKEALKLMRGTIPSNIRIEEKVNTKCGPILADPIQMHQVIMNLCTNAWHAMRETGGTMTVTLSEVIITEAMSSDVGTIKPGNAVQLSVQDTGCGMDEDTLQRIFEPYFTTKEKAGGTGLGLATVHGIILNYKGALSVESKPGKGTVFKIFLPTIQMQTSADPEKKENRTALSGKGRLLIVDDEAILLDITQRALTDIGFDVTTARNGEDALRLFLAGPDKFDLLLTDMTMPGILGSQLSAQVKAIRPEIPVLMLTGFSDLLDEDIQKLCGINKILMKPVGIFDLAKSITELITTG